MVAQQPQKQYGTMSAHYNPINVPNAAPPGYTQQQMMSIN
jgi:hypothetical protein